MALYVNPVLSNRDYGLFRIGGPGLANCMFIVARAIILAKTLNVPILRPTWERLGIGQWIRKEKDKRFYAGMFKDGSIAQGLKKMWLLLTRKHIAESEAFVRLEGVVMVEGLGRYFVDIKDSSDLVRNYFIKNILPSAIAQVPQTLKSSIAVHVRLGDYPREWRTDISWYVDILRFILGHVIRYDEVLVFSDGTDDELADLLAVEGTRRVFFGNALADMVAISRCGLLIGSASTFSCWGTYLGNVPSIYPRPYIENLYDGVLDDYNLVCIADTAKDLDETFLTRVTLM